MFLSVEKDAALATVLTLDLTSSSETIHTIHQMGLFSVDEGAKRVTYLTAHT